MGVALRPGDAPKMDWSYRGLRHMQEGGFEKCQPQGVIGDAHKLAEFVCSPSGSVISLYQVDNRIDSPGRVAAGFMFVRGQRIVDVQGFFKEGGVVEFPLLRDGIFKLARQWYTVGTNQRVLQWTGPSIGRGEFWVHDGLASPRVVTNQQGSLLTFLFNWGRTAEFRVSVTWDGVRLALRPDQRELVAEPSAAGPLFQVAGGAR